MKPGYTASKILFNPGSFEVGEITAVAEYRIHNECPVFTTNN